MSYRPKHPWRFVLIVSDGAHDRRMHQYMPAMPPIEKPSPRSFFRPEEHCPIHINYVGCGEDNPVMDPAKNYQN